LSRRIIFSGLKKKEDFSHHNSLHRKTHVEARMLDMFVSAVTVMAYYSVQSMGLGNEKELGCRTGPPD
jgi:hypothetical protein